MRNPPNKPGASNGARKRLEHVTPQTRITDWRTPKQMSRAVAEAKATLNLQRQAKRMRECARRLDFVAHATPEKISQTLKNAYACGDRMCPFCMKLKARKTIGILGDVIALHAEEYPKSLPVLFTGTMPNVDDADLHKAIGQLLAGCRRFSRLRPLKRRIKGAFRSVEITYNREQQTWHPHVHMLLFMEETYWRREDGLFLTQKDWLAYWRDVMDMPEIKVVDVRKVGRDRAGTLVLGDRLYGDLAEACKYLVKVGTVLERGHDRWHADPHLIGVLHRALKGRRLTSLTGTLRKLKRRLSLNGEAPDDSVLDGTDEIYVWDRIEANDGFDYWLTPQPEE